MNAPEGIPAFLDRRPLTWSYTMLHTYENICPHQAAERYVYKNVPFQETEAMRYGNEVHAAFELRVGARKPLPKHLQKWERFAAPFDRFVHIMTELKLAIDMHGRSVEYFDPMVFGRGKLDTVVIKDDTAFLNDWKTGNSKYESPFELEVGAVLLHAKFPLLKRIYGTYTWLKDEKISQVYDLSKTLETWNRICALARDITSNKVAGKFAKRAGPLCTHCPVYSCEHNKNANRG